MNLLAQLQAANNRPAAQPAQPAPRRTVRAERIVPGSTTEQIYLAMADGEVWSSILAADRFNLDRSTARSALERLVRFGLVSALGFVRSDNGGPTPLKLYRRKP